ncbi:hypothetical protein CHGG_04633 [Chaetomium globosum CBS 148.51]|uniref:Uncharacterized protein n=1 Tax=Chaetomium globosum (strain ATCC 6205 / CBS 148.51 / DSM 1962 / NBRC 6347 / NRRL 1970) TaxID=306901 RepID=Q2H0R3_CHAGB|nr:uncharacterized protein CHGG_04633 [Chaetomium globosum CBS 148.51]EAQ88014.1 hypothetical protein CHGG_04633 [Chaetomium globosum CBS 148.51]
MADVDRQQGGPSTSRRKKVAGKSKAQPANDWSRSGEPRSRASPRSNRHGDIDVDLVESSDDANDAHDAKASPRKQRRRRRPQPPADTTSDTASETTHPAKAPAPAMKGRSKSMRVPNASVPTPPRRPTCIIEPADEDDASPSGPSRPVSRQTIARRDVSPRSAHPYRSTPESRRSPRTSVSDSEDDTDATSDSDSEQVILPRGKLPAVPSAPPPMPAGAHGSLQERLMQRPEMVYEEEDGTSRYAPSARHRSLSRPASSGQDPYRRPRDITVSGPPSLDETRRSRSRSKSARPSRRHYESDVYISSRPASSFNNKRAHAASSYSLGSSAKRSTFFPADYSAPLARISQPEKPAERTTVCAHVGRVGVAVAEPRFARLATADGTTSLNARAMMTPPCSPLNNRQSGNRGNAATAAKPWWSRCGAELCPQCGGKWKSCECPSFTDDPFEAEIANPRANPFASRPPSPSPRDFRSDFAPPHAAITRPRPSSYEDDAHLRRLHEHHHRDDHLARRMHSFDEFGHHSGHADPSRRREDYDFETPEPRDRRRRADMRDFASPFADEDYHRRAATVVAPSPPQPHVPAAPPPPRSAFEPPSRPAFDRAASGFEYGAARRGRDARYASPERFDHYMPENYPTERRRPRSPDPWQAFPQEQRARSRDRRHTFPSESRPTSPEPWQLPTRYPSPERPVPAVEERRRAPSPDRRQASSFEQRLASRFKKESRQNPTAPIVPIGAAGPVGALGPLSPTRAPPPPSRAATHIGASMPMAPIPPSIHGGPPPAPSLRRHHTMDEDIYGPGAGMPGGGMPGGMPNGMPGAMPGGMGGMPGMSGSGMHGSGMPPPGDWFGPPLPHGHPHSHSHSHPPPPGMGMPMMHPGHHPAMHDIAPPDMNPANGGSHRAPHVRRRPPQAHREHSKYDIPRSSVLAGLGGMGRGALRVHEWVNYVEPGAPDDLTHMAMH